MKTKILCWTLAGVLILSFGCSNDTKIMSKEKRLVGNWKLTSLVNVSQETTVTLKPDLEDCYWITFNDNNTLVGKSSTNELIGNYEAYSETSTIRVTNLRGTKIGEILDGNKYVDCLQAAHSFSITDMELKLYYNNGKEYLLYTKDGKGYIEATDLNGTGYVFAGSVPSELQNKKNIMYIIYNETTNSATFSANCPEASYDGKIINLTDFTEGWKIPDEGIQINYAGVLYQQGIYLVSPPRIGGYLILTALNKQ